jgi:deazaflavin-dependent oxidoreductase (nitroreductase family)
MASPQYQRPGWITRYLLNPAIAGLLRLGVSVLGSRTLAVRGRRSGEWRTTPVHPMNFGGRRYLVAPRGTTEWVRNIRARGGGELRLGRRSEPISVVELEDDAKPEILREYLRRFGWETGAFFQGVSSRSSEEDLHRIAPLHPVFRIVSSPSNSPS